MNTSNYEQENRIHISLKLLLSGSVAIKGISAGLGFLVSVLLARLLQPEGYGVFAFAISLATLISLPVQAGMPQFVVRETAKAYVQSSWNKIASIWRWSNIVTLSFSLVIVLLVFVILALLHDRHEPTIRNTLYLAVLAIPFLALGNIRGASLRGIHHPIIGQLPETILRPLLLVVSLLLIAWYPSQVLIPEHAMMFFLVASILAYITGAVILRIHAPENIWRCTTYNYNHHQWIRSAIPFALIGVAQLVMQHTDIIMLMYFMESDSVGIYKVSMSLAGLLLLGVMPLNRVIAPRLASAAHTGNIKVLNETYKLAALYACVLSAPILILYLAAGERIIIFAYGPIYAAALAPLLILSIGYVINAAASPTLTTLNMCGKENYALKSLTVGAIVNVILNLMLIPSFGPTGAALGTAISTIITVSILQYHVLNRTPITVERLLG